MRLEVKEMLDEADMRRYDRLVRESPAGSVFATRSWLDYSGITARFFGAYKGAECIAGVAVPYTGGSVPSIVRGTPWTGIVAREASEGEHLQVAGAMAEYVRREFGYASLTMPPEWNDIRGFLWDGWRAHVRYTYRGWGALYESRVRIRNCDIRSTYGRESNDWYTRIYTVHDSEVKAAFDWKYAYYCDANPGGTWHTECADRMITDARARGKSFDMVGCNSPLRSLFKRGFGGKLTPYYFVTTGDPADVEEFWGERRPERIAA